MNRRTFCSLAAAALAAPGSAVATPPAVRFSVMLWALAQAQPDFTRRLEMVAEAGYQGVELTGEFHAWSAVEQADTFARLRSLHLDVDSISGVEAGFAAPAEQTGFFRQLAEHLRIAGELQCPQIILLSGKRLDALGPQAQRTLAVENLKRAAALAAEKHVEIVIEPIDLLENPAIYMASVTDAFAIANAVHAPNLKVLYDLYHEQRSFGNLLEKLEQNIGLIGLVHAANVPGRHEPDGGEIDYPVVYRKLGELGYDRWIAMEYYPTGEPVASLRRSREEASVALRAGLSRHLNR